MTFREFAVSGFQIYWEEVPVKDARIMDDKAVDVLSTTSSELSDSLRDQILGRPYSRARKPKNPVIPLKTRSLLYDQIISGSNKIADEKLSASSAPKIETILEIEPNKANNSSKPSVNQNSSLPKTNSGSGRTVESKGKLISEEPIVAKLVPENLQNQDRKTSSNILTSNNVDNTPIYYVAAETQTTDLSSTESAGEFVMDHKCKCCMWQTSCNIQNCGCGSSYNDDDSTLVLDETTSQPFDEFSESTTQTSLAFCNNSTNAGRACCRCCCNHWDTLEDDLSDQSDCPCDYVDLPYQNNEEYLKLLSELEDKLLARNKERVRRTMREFEYRSRLNMNLDKPIFDEEEPILSRLSPNKGKCPCCRPKTTRADSDIFQNERVWECRRLTLPQKRGNRLQEGRSLKGSRWQLDPRSGEWVKVASFIEGDDGFAGSGCSKMAPNGPKLDGPSSCCRKEHCRRHGRF